MQTLPAFNSISRRTDRNRTRLAARVRTTTLGLRYQAGRGSRAANPKRRVPSMSAQETRPMKRGIQTIKQPRAVRTVDEALNVLARTAGHFFLSLHIIDPHWRYLPPEDFVERFDPRPPYPRLIAEQSARAGAADRLSRNRTARQPLRRRERLSGPGNRSADR